MLAYFVGALVGILICLIIMFLVPASYGYMCFTIAFIAAFSLAVSTMKGKL